MKFVNANKINRKSGVAEGPAVSPHYSCRTAFVRLRGWSTSIPFWIANW